VTEGAHHVDIDGLLVYESAGQGLLVTKGSSTAPYALQVWNSEFRDNGTSSQYDHGIYVGAVQRDPVTGAPSVIANTLIRDNKGYGIQAYPESSALLVTGCTIDGHATKSAVVIGGSGSSATANARVVGSLLTNNREFAVRVNWEGPVGSGNVVAESLAAANGASGDYQSPGGVSYQGVVENVDPQYVDRAAGDFRLRPSSPARSLVSANLGYLPATDRTGAARPAGCAGAYCASAS
jgi:Right handed beta helix region